MMSVILTLIYTGQTVTPSDVSISEIRRAIQSIVLPIPLEEVNCVSVVDITGRFDLETPNIYGSLVIERVKASIPRNRPTPSSSYQPQGEVEAERRMLPEISNKARSLTAAASQQSSSTFDINSRKRRLDDGQFIY